MKIWILFSTWYKYGDGDCPINEVEGVFTNKERAEELAKILNKKNTGADYWVDEFIIDDESDIFL